MTYSRSAGLLNKAVSAIAPCPFWGKVLAPVLIPARFDAVSLSIARFVPVVPFCLAWVLVARRRQALALLRRFPVRAPIAGLLSVPAYNLALYSGQQRGVPAPVASLTTALMPFAVMLLAALFLGEALSWRKGAAFALALAGLALAEGIWRLAPRAEPAIRMIAAAVQRLEPRAG